MSEDIKGVFVQLPLSDERREVFVTEMDCGAEVEQAILAIGTPVTGGDLYPVGYTSEDAIGGLATGVYSFASIFRDNDAEHYDTVPLVRQSDAQAQIAVLEADVAQKDQRIAELEEELSGFRAGLSELIAKEVATLKGGAA